LAFQSFQYLQVTILRDKVQRDGILNIGYKAFEYLLKVACSTNWKRSSTSTNIFTRSSWQSFWSNLP